MNFNITPLSDEQAAYEMNRKKGASSEWPQALGSILASPLCDISKTFVVELDVPENVKQATIVAGLNRAAKAAKHTSLIFRIVKGNDAKFRAVNKVAAK